MSTTSSVQGTSVENNLEGHVLFKTPMSYPRIW